MESEEREEIELGGIDTALTQIDMADLAMEVEAVMDYIAEEVGGEVIGEYIPRIVTEEDVAAYAEIGGDLYMRSEVEDAIFRGQWITTGLMEIEIATWDDILYGEGEMTPVEEALDFGLITEEQAEWCTEPSFTEEELIHIVEQGMVVQMFPTQTLVELDAEELIVGNFLMEMGRPDLLDHIITMEPGELAEINRELAEGRWMRGALSSGGRTSEGAVSESPVRSMEGRMREALNDVKDDNEAERSITERVGEEIEEQNERICIGGVIDERTCGGCRAAIGTCGPASEMSRPPFHEHCRCGAYKQ